MSNALPVRISQFDLEGFLNWLAKNGAEIGTQTNPYEVVRYRAYRPRANKAATHVVYRKDNGMITFTGESRKHYQAFLDRKTIAGMFVGKFDGPQSDELGAILPSGMTKSEKRRTRLIDRDGSDCWFCGLPMGDDITIEHLVSRSKGGVDHLDNYALAHQKCNADAGDRPLVEKIAMRVAMRKETT